jgi:hypothetical protein
VLKRTRRSGGVLSEVVDMVHTITIYENGTNENEMAVDALLFKK